MKIYALTDELAEEVINVFMAKNDSAAVKLVKADLQTRARQNEVKLYALDIEIGYDEKFYAFYDDGDDKSSRVLYSFPDDVNLTKEEVIEKIQKDGEL